MFDTHLINMALAGLSISAGAAILIAIAIIGIAAIVLHAKARRGSTVSATASTTPAAPAEPERLAA
jgi:hypothetical protein